MPALSQTLLAYQTGDVLELCQTAQEQALDLVGFVSPHAPDRGVCHRGVCHRGAFVIGNRGVRTCRKLWEAIATAYKAAHCFADIWQAYSKVIAARQLTQSESKANTNHIERFNCTLRQRLARLVRETCSFSKSDTMHKVVLTLFIHSYYQNKLSH